MATSVLIVEDDVDTSDLLRAAVKKHGIEAVAVNSAKAALDHLAVRPVDVVVTDHLMDGMTGIELCQQIRERYPDSLSIILTGQGSLDVAIAAIRAGAYDFITKPVKADALMIAIDRATEHLGLRKEVKRLRTAADHTAKIDGIIGDSPPVRAAAELIRRVADSDATVLITGESGTGKELVARSLHDLSSRRQHPFVAVNCAAMPAPLLESELFGHLRGAFTDAKQARAGLFVQAGKGTMFLDEIGEMPMEMQVKLLRVLQERKVRPVGGDEEVPVHCRILCATNRDLEIEIEDRRFREDLYYRINVVAIPVPPLRDRGSDVIVLARHFLAKIAGRTNKPITGISSEAAAKLVAYDWPGNVRELENCMERVVALCRTPEVSIDDLPTKVKDHQSTRMMVSTDAPDELVTLEEMERRYVRQVVHATSGNKTFAARVLGIDRRSLYRRLAQAATDDKR